MELTERFSRLAGGPVTDVVRIGEQHGWRHYRARLGGGQDIFVKHSERIPPGLMRAEAHGLRWLAEAGSVSVPELLGWDESTLILAWVPAGQADRAAAERFGRELAGLHAAGAATLGAPWPGFIASLPLSNEPTEPAGPDGRDNWPGWYAAHRLAPYLRWAADAGTLDRGCARLVEAVMSRIDDLAGPGEPPSRIHGDCWAGKVLWSGGRGWLVDPAAHGGHRETDLAMLALFGAPQLERILAAYCEEAPLGDGWRARVPLHQLHPLLVHACLFGAGYAGSVQDAARSALAI